MLHRQYIEIVVTRIVNPRKVLIKKVIIIDVLLLQGHVAGTAKLGKERWCSWHSVAVSIAAS